MQFGFESFDQNNADQQADGCRGNENVIGNNSGKVNVITEV